MSGEELGRIRAFANNGSNEFTEVTGAANPFNGIDVGDYSFVSFADIDGDSDTDLVTGSDNALLRTFRNNGSGVFSESTGAANPFNGFGIVPGGAPAFGDVNNDGNIDLVTGTATGTFRVFTGNGSGTFTDLGASSPFAGVNIGMYSTPTFGDIDGDGDGDMVAGTEAGQFATFRNDGAGGWVRLTGTNNPLNGVNVGSYSAPALFDYDDDGDVDLVSGNSSGGFVVSLNDGAGTFTGTLRGYSAGNYTDSFNGTSASTPVVSGVVALMLDANSGLGWRDVQNILANSASLTGSAFNATTANATEDGLWYANSSGTWNGGGNHLHTNYGYGMVNAYNAVRMAEVWTLFAAAQTSANEQHVASGTNDLGNASINNTSLTTTFTIAQNVEIEHLSITLDFQTTWIGNLNLTLTSAEGTVVRVLKATTAMNVDYNGKWIFGVDSLRGELSAGTWTLTMSDTAIADDTIVRNVSMDFYGSVDSNNDTYHFTSEYLAMRGFDATRGTITDSNGGTDWLNLAAVAGNVVLNMATGQTFSVDSTNWAQLSGDFENAVTGDGNDTITGNDLANALHGMRGDDTIEGGEAADKLFGAAGADTLDGGEGNDALTGGLGADTIDGGNGIDLVSFRALPATGVSVTLDGSTAVVVSGALDTIVNVENVFGTNLADTITGDGADNVIRGFRRHGHAGGEGRQQHPQRRRRQ